MNDYVDDQELEDELDQLQQEQLDEQMLNTGNVPVSDAVHRLPTPAKAERKSPFRDMDRRGTDMTQLYQTRSRLSRRTTRKRNSGSFRPRWRCKETPGGLLVIA